MARPTNGSINIKFVFRVLVSCLLVGYLIFKVNWVHLIASLKDVNIFLYLSSTIIALLSSFLLASKYYLLIRKTPIAKSVFVLTKINLITRFYNLFIPSAIGRDAIRWYKVTKNQRGRGFFFISTIFERLTFLFVLTLSGLIPLYFPTQNTSIIALRNQIGPVLFFSMILICIGLGYFFIPPLRHFVLLIVSKLPTRFWKNHDPDKVLSNFVLRNPKPTLYLGIFGLSLIWQLFFLIRLFILFRSASLQLSIIDVAWMGSIVLLLQVLPISFAGLGVRESAYAYLFTIYNLPPENGVMIGILFFSQMLILAGTGAFLEFLNS